MKMHEVEPELEQDESEPSPPREGDAAAEARASHLGFVAHEIRNPLSTALWTAELLGRMDATERGGARGEKLSGMCLRSLQRVRHLIEDHLVAERLDTGLYPVRPESTPLLDVLVSAEGRRAVAEPPMEPSIPGDLAVLADRTLLARLVDTLLDAASQGASTLRVGARATDGEVSLAVRGTPADPKLLEDPLKGAASDTRGRALALPAARRMAARMGGRLEARDGAWILTLPEAMHERGDEG